ncbi:type II toxin-antitoxin system PemK/MazF family toxin [Pedobacter aquae]|uniref:Type II toxin-antitoxin system PemK/MazF family toxin n=1 Tax=Pedobacter aquae TaxID=2605747 RepID=A0A5C0VLY5_9SPHI|nr:type II toxin-antitoxin system PemK/MazF family toxin [Pedobacter aquae]QEK52902.1 type II toxin-antitoxin system PemK/MazF family toxin [Pedobacter aquae]
MSYKQGDIVLLPFPFTNQSNSKKRPAMVISGNTMNNTSDIMVVQITKEIRNDEYSVKLPISELTKPLKFVSEIRCHKILVADKSLIDKSPISTVSDEIINQVKDKIKDILDN